MSNRKRKLTEAQLRERVQRGGGVAVVDPSARGMPGRKRARSATNNTLVLSVFAVQINTLFKPFSEAEAVFLERCLSQTIERTIRIDRFNEFINMRWPEHRETNDVIQFISPPIGVSHREERGNPYGTGGRVHAHCMVYIQHNSNIHFDVPDLNRSTVLTWNQVIQEQPDSGRIGYTDLGGGGVTFAEMFHSEWPERKFNVRVSAVRASNEVHALWYMTKNDPKGRQFWLSGKAKKVADEFEQEVFSQQKH